MHKRVKLLLCAAAAMCTISIQVQAEEESLHIDPGIIVDESEPEIITLGRAKRLRTTEPVRVLALHRSTGG